MPEAVECEDVVRPKSGAEAHRELIAQSPQPFRGRALVIFLSVLLMLAVFYTRNAPTHLAHYTDPVIYLSGAQSIAEGNGYRFITHVGTPKIGCHPPLQSTYLALFWSLNSNFPQNLP